MKRAVFYMSLVAVLVTVAYPGPAVAARAKTETETLEGVTKRTMKRIFDESEKAIIEEYFGREKSRNEEGKKQAKKEKGGKSKQLPPGLAKKETLPPGLAQQVEKNGALPPGLAKRDLPKDLEDLLPPPPKGTKRVIAGDDVILVETGTEIVLDVLRGVLNGQK